MEEQSSSNGKPYVAYVRISVLGGREAGNNLSAENQLKSIRTTAKRHELELNPDWTFSDEDVSGQTFERAGWQQVVALVKGGHAGGVVVWNQARASRAKSWETMAMIAAVEQAGGRIYAQSGQITVATFEGEVMAFMNGAADNRFAVEKAAQLKQSVADAIDRGAHLSAPYGYRKAARVASRAMPLKIHKAEAQAVHLMYELRAGGMSWAKIAARLNDLGHKPRPHVRGGKQVQGGWRHQAVRDIVVSETYLGIAHNGPVRKRGAHPAIVTPELWAQANAVKGVKPIAPEDGYTLSGLVRCSSCGRVMSHTVTRGRGYFKCLNQGATKCPAPVSVPEAPLTEWVVGHFDAEYLGQLFHAEESGAPIAEAEARVEHAANALEEAMSHQLRFLATGGSHYNKSARPRAEEIGANQVRWAEHNLAAAEAALHEARNAARRANLPAWLDAEAFHGLPVFEQNRWLATVYAFVVVRKDPVWRGPIDARAKLVRAVDVLDDPIAAAVNR